MSGEVLAKNNWPGSNSSHLRSLTRFCTYSGIKGRYQGVPTDNAQTAATAMTSGKCLRRMRAAEATAEDRFTGSAGREAAAAERDGGRRRRRGTRATTNTSSRWTPPAMFALRSGSRSSSSRRRGAERREDDDDGDGGGGDDCSAPTHAHQPSSLLSAGSSSSSSLRPLACCRYQPTWQQAILSRQIVRLNLFSVLITVFPSFNAKWQPRIHKQKHAHTHTVLTATFLGELWLTRWLPLSIYLYTVHPIGRGPNSYRPWRNKPRLPRTTALTRIKAAAPCRRRLITP